MKPSSSLRNARSAPLVLASTAREPATEALLEVLLGVRAGLLRHDPAILVLRELVLRGATRGALAFWAPAVLPVVLPLIEHPRCDP